MVTVVEDEILDAPSPNFDDRDQPVSMVVLHYTGMQDGASAIARLRDPEAGVSSHYVVAEDGRDPPPRRRGQARLACRQILLARACSG